MRLCDLCGSQNPVWDWLTPNTVTQEEAEAGQGWYFEDPHWWICEHCHQLILDDKPDHLRMRAFVNLPPLAEAILSNPFLRDAMEEGQRAEVARMHEAFWKHRDTYTQIQEPLTKDKEQP